MPERSWREGSVRKVLISVVAAVVSLGVIGVAPAAFAGPVDTSSTTEVAGYPPEATTTTVEETTTTESESGPVTLQPQPSVSSEVIGADLPSTGGGIAPLQIGAGMIIVGLLVIVFVRRRRATPAT